MAIFNPQVPQGKDEMPDWTKVTRPVSEITADKSTGLALAGIGQGIEGAAGLIETTAKDIINKDVRSTVEPIREDYTNKLLATKAMIQGAGAAVPPASDSMTMDLMQHEGQHFNVPGGIDAGLKKVDRIQNLLLYGSGKLGVDETYYDMRLKTAVTDLRSKYPGFVDYIDQRVSSITGINPANELIRDATHQIAQLQASKKTEYDKEVDLARKAFSDGMLGAKEQFETLLSRGEGYLPTWRNWYATESRKWQQIKENDILRKDRRETDADFKDTRLKDWTNLVSSDVSTAMNTTVSIVGVKDPKKLSEFMDDFQAHPEKYNSDQMRQLAVMVKSQGASVGARLDQRASKVDTDSAGKRYSFNSDIGADDVQKTKTSIMRYFENMHDALMNDKAGVAYYWAQRAAGMKDDRGYEIASGPEGEALDYWEYLKNKVGDQAVPNLMTGAVKLGLDKTVTKLFEKNMLKAKTQVDPQGNDNATPYTFKDLNDQALSLEQSKQMSKALRSRYINGGMNLMLKDITDPDTPDPAKINAIQFFFSPEGQGVLNHFNNDRRNPITGKEEPGKQTLWNKLTSDETAASIKKLSERYPDVGLAYTRWVTKEAGAGLFYKDLQNLNTITGRDDLYIKYHDGKGEGAPKAPYIELLSDRGALESPVGQKGKIPQYGIPDYEQGGIDVGRRTPYEGRIKMAKESINRVNEGLRGVDRVYKQFGGDSSAMLLQFMSGAQVEVGKNWEGLPKQIMDAIAAAQGKGKLQDLFEQKKKEKESK